MPKSPEEQMASMIAGLEEKTGRTYEDWSRALRKSGASRHGEMVQWLKAQGVTHGYANLIAHKLLGSDAVSQAMCTHRVRVEKPADVDAELIGWLKQAYHSAG